MESQSQNSDKEEKYDYFKDLAINNSLLKYIRSNDHLGFLKEWQRMSEGIHVESDNPSLQFGSLVHAYLEDPESFIVYEGSIKPQPKSFIEEVSKITDDELITIVINEGGSDDYKIDYETGETIISDEVKLKFKFETAYKRIGAKVKIESLIKEFEENSNYYEFLKSGKTLISSEENTLLSKMGYLIEESVNNCMSFTTLPEFRSLVQKKCNYNIPENLENLGFIESREFPISFNLDMREDVNFESLFKIKIKGKIDLMLEYINEEEGKPNLIYIFDFKTINDLSEQSIKEAIIKYKYDQQLFFYSKLIKSLNQNLGIEDPFIITCLIFVSRNNLDYSIPKICYFSVSELEEEYDNKFLIELGIARNLLDDYNKLGYKKALQKNILSPHTIFANGL